MKKFLKNHKGSIVLVLSMIIGLIIGLIFKEKATILEPLGNLFINLLSTIVVPIVIVTITLSIAKIRPKNVISLLKYIIIVFIIMSLLSVLTGIIATKSYKFVSDNNKINITNKVDQNNEKPNYLEKTVDTLSVNDFNKLLSKDNLMAIITFSIILGVAISITKDKKSTVIKLLEETESILMNILKIIMYYAPVGIMAYFATMVGSLGAQIAIDYVKVFIYYFIISILFAIIVYSIIAKISGKSIKKFWIESIPVILTSLGTCSSAATIPVNIKSVDKMGVSPEASKTTISLGTSFHKDGSVIDSVFKIMFLVYLFNSNVSVFTILIVALLATLLVTAVPIGGGTISEMLIITLLGFPLSALPILTIIATITDAPATMLNALGDTSASLLIDKLYKKDTN